MPLSADDVAVVEAFLRRYGALPRRDMLACRPAVPVESLQAAALRHHSAAVRRECLNALDHYANDEATAVFRAALADPVPSVRLVALHALSCEVCRTTELCVADVAAELIHTLEHDPSAKVRHGAVAVLGGLAGRSADAMAALARAAESDADPLVRDVAQAAFEGRFRDVRSRKALRRRARRSDVGAAGR